MKEIEDNGFYYENLKKMSDVIKNKKDDPEDLEYWIDYAFEVGTEHLRS